LVAIICSVDFAVDMCWWEKPLVVALIPIVGILLPLRNGSVHDHCSKEAKHTSTQYLTWFGKLPTSTGEINIIRDKERIQHTEKDHIHSTPISHCYIGQQLHRAAAAYSSRAAGGSPSLSFSLLLSFVLALSLILCCTPGVYL